MDVITLGESMVLLTSTTSGPLRFTTSFSKSLAGAESNVAIALSRLGHEVGWISKLGNDEFGLYVRNTIRGEGIDASQVKMTNSAQTGVLFKELALNTDPNIFYYRNGSAASTLMPEDVDLDYVKKAKYIHITGITPALSESCLQTVNRLIDIAVENKQKIVFDPNVRFKLWENQEIASETLLKIAYRSNIIMPGIDEAKFLTGESCHESIALYFLSKGIELVVIKLGAEGAYYHDGINCGYVPGEKVPKIVDTVGAGDGFCAGVISGLLRGWNHFDAVQLGNKIGAAALSVRGDS